MAAKKLTATQSAALSHLFDVVLANESKLRGSLPEAHGQMERVGELLAGGIRKILDALGNCKASGLPE